VGSIIPAARTKSRHTRHAGDTPQRSAYGSNSPQATNEHKPHHQDNWTRMSNTTHATTPP